MDHWGDPWADDANNDSHAFAKDEVKPPPTAPQNTAFGGVATAPVLLNGFLDDAQWGNEDWEEDFGGWASSTSGAADPGAETRIHKEEPTSTAQNSPEPAIHGGYGEPAAFNLQDEGWGDVEAQQHTQREAENVVSEASDSATTIQPEDTPERISADLSDALHPDDDLSTRPSTSPSDVSHTEAASESPRTSFEDERAAGKAVAPVTERREEEQDTSLEGSATASQENAAKEGSDGDDFGDFEDTHQLTTGHHTDNKAVESEAIKREKAHPASRYEDDTKVSVSTPSAPIPGLQIDPTLLSQLFPIPESSDNIPQAPDDPVYSTSARKAWYRLTRKQTMREFNAGGDEDNNVRVNWQNSRIRLDVNKIVSRWSGEDRLAGRGPGGRASFFWDQPHPDSKAPNSHVPKQSSVSASSSARPAKQTVQPLSTNVPASFDWSSPSVAHDPWKQDSLNGRAVSSPLAAKPVSVSKVQKQEHRSASVDLTPRNEPPVSHHKTASLITPVSNVASIPSPAFPTSKPSLDAPRGPWGDLSGLDTTPQTQPNSQETAIEDEDDDDWGEMVEPEATSTPAASEAFPPSPQPPQPTSTPSSTPKRSARSSPFQPPSSKHASPIVRLKTTVSPTSALFGMNNFIPTNVEEGPIGPSILKPANKPTPEKPRAEPEQHSVPATTVDDAPTTATSNDDTASILSSPAPTPVPEPTPDHPKDIANNSSLKSSLPKSEPPPTPDPWSTADFSIFESSTPLPSQPTPSTHLDPTDPFSIFNTPAPAPAQIQTTPSPFSRPPPRPKTPPSQQPLTGATNSAQKRKAEEDDVIRGILAGLPDLGYMLRR